MNTCVEFHDRGSLFGVRGVGEVARMSGKYGGGSWSWMGEGVNVLTKLDKQTLLLSTSNMGYHIATVQTFAKH